MAYENLMMDGLAGSFVAFRKNGQFARVGTTDVTPEFEMAPRNNEVTFNIYNRPAVEKNYSSGDSPPATNPLSTTKASVKTDQRWRVPYHIDDPDAQDIWNTAEFMRMGMAAGEALADAMDQHIGAILIGACGHNVTAVDFSASGDQVSDVETEIFKRDVRSGMLYGILTADTANKLRKTPEFDNVDERGPAAVTNNLRGSMGMRMNVDWLRSNNFPVIPTGNFAVNGAKNAGSREIAVDGAGASGVPIGSVITIGSQGHYGVVKGISGASGTIMLSQALRQNAADNAAVTRVAVKGTVFVGGSVAWAIRGTPANNLGNRYIVTERDDITRIALTMEIMAGDERTKYIYRARFGGNVIRPEQVEVLI